MAAATPCCVVQYCCAALISCSRSYLLCTTSRATRAFTSSSTAQRPRFTSHYRLLLVVFFAVLAARLNCASVGAPREPGERIRSPLPAAILARLRRMFSYNPGFLVAIYHALHDQYRAVNLSLAVSQLCLALKFERLPG